MKKYKYYISLNLLLLVYSFGGVFLKLAGRENFFSFRFIFYYSATILLLLLYAFFWQQIIKKLSLTAAYANKAVAIIWTMLWGIIFFNEAVTLNMIMGVIIVIAGVGLVVTSNE